MSVGSNSTTFTTDYKDIWIASLGTEYDFAERWSAGIGFSYVSSPVDDGERSIGLPLDEFFIPGFGLKYLWGDRTTIHSNFLVSICGDGQADE